MTTKEKFVFALYVTTSVAVVAHSTVEIWKLAREERRANAAMKKHIEENPLSI